jgi:hypothetical protein
MSEYRVSYTEVPAECEDKKTYGGLLIHILPPVQLNPKVVERYLTYGSLDRTFDSGEETSDIKDVALLGSTPEQTTIYASVANGYEAGVLAQEIAKDTVKLLRLMGATAIINHPPTPEA